jgi:hypothetical protein
MATFLSVHGYDPGPTQRPLLAGAISGALATVPAIAILMLLGSLAVEAKILRASELATVVAGCVLMAAAGAVYGRLFGRAANIRRGGWLFGMTFGFALWAGGAMLVLPLAGAGEVPAGEAAIGLFLSFVAWGATLGIVYPFVHRPLHESLESAAKRASVGPDAATRSGGRPPQRLRPPPPAPEDRPRS